MTAGLTTIHICARRCLATATLTSGLAIGIAVNANATPADDFWECAGDHQDTDGIGVCCIFYGGDYDERSGECYIDEATLAPTSPDGGQTGPTVRPGLPALTPAPLPPVNSVG